MRSSKHPFPAGKLPVRGKIRITSMLIGPAAVSNVRRIDRYLQAKLKKNWPRQWLLELKNTPGNGPWILFGLFYVPAWRVCAALPGQKWQP